MGNKNKKRKNNSDQNIDSDNFFVKAMIDDTYNDIKNDKSSMIYQWWNENVIINEKLSKYIHNKMIEKSIEIVLSNQQ